MDLLKARFGSSSTIDMDPNFWVICEVNDFHFDMWAWPISHFLVFWFRLKTIKQLKWCHLCSLIFMKRRFLFLAQKLGGHRNINNFTTITGNRKLQALAQKLDENFALKLKTSAFACAKMSKTIKMYKWVSSVKSKAKTLQLGFPRKLGNRFAKNSHFLQFVR